MHNAVLLDDGLEKLESKGNEIKSEFPFLKNDLKIEKDYKMVQNTKEEDNVKESCRKNKIRGRLKKSVKTIPRIRIRTIPIPLKLKSLDSQVNMVSDKEKKTKRKAKLPLKLCEIMILPHESFNVKSECLEKLKQNNENKDNDPNTLPPETDKIKNKLRKSELKALLPSLYRFQCHVCDYICKNWNSLRSHCKDSHQATPQVTCVCSKVLMTRTAVIEHRSKHTDNTTYRCEKCEKTFHRKSLLNLHIMSHLPKEEQPFVCCKCARRFHCEALLRNHERVHLPKEERLIYPCHLCHKKFSSKSAVSAHLKAVHLGERPFVCDQCGHSFTSKGILQEHLTIHSDEAPWNCSNCNKNFKTKYRLKIHMDTHRETPYQCPKCPVQLSTRRTLRMHLVIHRDTKAYQCSTCGKAFRRAKDLKVSFNPLRKY
uniref:C2H2-type domain-containing protein n=1 Tax=Clastoptera arizonana TaxID=38151 RepID=A0A1B6CGW8_9HEMI